MHEHGISIARTANLLGITQTRSRNKKWKPPKGYIGSKTIVNDCNVPRSTLQGWAERDEVKPKKDPQTKECYYPKKWVEKRRASYKPRRSQT